MTDYICSLPHPTPMPLLVSVTRAMRLHRRRGAKAFPFGLPQAKALLRKKLAGAHAASLSVLHAARDEDEDDEGEDVDDGGQGNGNDEMDGGLSRILLPGLGDHTSLLPHTILHIWVPTGRIASVLHRAWRSLSLEETRHITILCAVVDLPWVFTNHPPRSLQAQMSSETSISDSG